MRSILFLSILGLGLFDINFARVVAQGSVLLIVEEKTNEECMVVEIGVGSSPDVVRVVVAIGQGTGAGGAGGMGGGMSSTSYSWRVRSVRKKNNLVATDLFFTYKSAPESFVVKKKFNTSPGDVRTHHLPHRVKVKAYFGPCT